MANDKLYSSAQVPNGQQSDRPGQSALGKDEVELHGTDGIGGLAKDSAADTGLCGGGETLCFLRSGKSYYELYLWFSELG